MDIMIRYHASFLLALIILFTFTVSLPLAQASGAPPPVSRQIITDEEDDWKYIPMTQNSSCTSADLEGSVKIPDMVGASYSSDGKYLNATIWLSGLFEDQPTPILARMPKYSMTIGIIQPYDLEVKADYVNSLDWNPINQVWTMTINEYLKNNTRTLVQDNNNISRFFDNTGNQGHVNLSLDLEKISSPSQYLVSFIMTDVKIHRGNICFMIDIIEEAGQIPLQEFSLSTSPDPLEIRHGEEKIIEARINSTSLTNPFATLKVYPDHGSLETYLEPNSITIPPAGIANLHIRVKVSEQVPPASYSPEIRSNYSFPISINSSSIVNTTINQIITSSIPSIDPAILDLSDLESAPTIANATSISQRPSYLAVVVKPYPFGEQFSDFFNTYGDLISLVGGGFAAGFSAMSIDRLKNRSKSKRMKGLDG